MQASYVIVDLYVTEIEGLGAISVILSFCHSKSETNLANNISTMEASKGFDISHENSLWHDLFISSPEPLGQFQPNFSQSILG